MFPEVYTEARQHGRNHHVHSTSRFRSSIAQVGNAGRPPSGRAPGFWNADMSLAKTFYFTEAKYLDFRWNVFNAFNHQNLGIPNSNFCLPQGPNGEIDYVRQFGCSFGQITNVQTDPRGMEFSLRFQF